MLIVSTVLIQHRVLYNKTIKRDNRIIIHIVFTRLISAEIFWVFITKTTSTFLERRHFHLKPAKVSIVAIKKPNRLATC